MPNRKKTPFKVGQKIHNYTIDAVLPDDKDYMLYSITCHCGEEYINTHRQLQSKVNKSNTKNCKKCFFKEQKGKKINKSREVKSSYNLPEIHHKFISGNW